MIEEMQRCLVIVFLSERGLELFQARFVEDDGRLFIIFNFIFSLLLVIFLMLGSRW